MIIKALSLKQPWAAQVAEKNKLIETRTWRTHYRGEFLICVSWSIDEIAQQTIGCPYHTSRMMNERGRAIAIAELYDMRPMTPADESLALCKSEPGRFAWMLRGVRRIASFPVKGQLGLFDVDVPELIYA